MSRKVSAWILAVALLLLGISSLAAEKIPTDGEPLELSTLSYEDVEKNRVYKADALLIADYFATLNDDEVYYMTVLYMDKDENLVVANMPVGENSPIRDDVESYLGDASLYIGDYVIECYVQTAFNKDEDNKLLDFYNEEVDNLSAILEYPLTKSLWRLEYVCGPDGDPYATARTDNTMSTVAGIVFTALGVILVIVGFVMPKAKPQTVVQQSAPDASRSPYAGPVPPHGLQSPAQLRAPVQSPERPGQLRRGTAEALPGTAGCRHYE